MKLYIMCGPSGVGKSTWAKDFISIEENKGKIAYVSRDEIRMHMLEEDDDYFAHEKEVFKQFVQAIVHYLPYNDVIADATHLNEFSRRKLTQAIDNYMTDYEIIYVYVSLGYDECIKRNAQRTGRARVPDNVIANMFRDFRIPSLNEDERALEVWEASV